MRKQDRVAASQQQSRHDDSESTGKSEQKSQEKVKGSAADQPAKPPRQGNKLPLPD